MLLGTLPAMHFFVPNDTFISNMQIHFHGLQLFDVGAGCGHVSAMLDGAGFDVFAIDLCARSVMEFPVANFNGSYFPYPSGSVAMILRPCHGHFVEGVIAQAVRCGVAAIVYVSKPRNVSNDLFGFDEFCKIADAVGSDGESMYAWKLPRKDDL